MRIYGKALFWQSWIDFWETPKIGNFLFNITKCIKDMVSIKVKFRFSKSEGQPGKVYYQVIHERVVRQWFSDYKIFNSEWDSRQSTLIIPTDGQRRHQLQCIGKRIKWDRARFSRIITALSNSKESYTADDIIEEFKVQSQAQMFFPFMGDIINRLRLPPAWVMPRQMIRGVSI